MMENKNLTITHSWISRLLGRCFEIWNTGLYKWLWQLIFKNHRCDIAFEFSVHKQNLIGYCRYSFTCYLIFKFITMNLWVKIYSVCSSDFIIIAICASCTDRLDITFGHKHYKSSLGVRINSGCKYIQLASSK